MGEAMAKARVPAVEGWFTLDEAEPRLLGARCPACRTVFFPKEAACRNPHCAHDGELEETPLSARGRLWSYTTNGYAPPPPFVAKDPYVPFAVAAVELEAEKMVVRGGGAPRGGDGDGARAGHAPRGRRARLPGVEVAARFCRR